MRLDVVILAAGQGKRMHARLPKVLHRVGGETMIARVIGTARELEPGTICVVYGHGGEQVPRAVGGADVVFVRQHPQLGTGDALRRALPMVSKSDRVLVLYGDVPLVSADTLAGLVASRVNGVMVLTAMVASPTGYGRVVRDRARRVKQIVEEADATPAQRRIREINTGIMVLPTRRLESWLSALRPRNAQGEYYLPDVIAQARAAGVPVAATRVADAVEVMGVNTPAQLAQVERVYQHRYAQRLLESGTWLADPARLDVRGELKCGNDVAIDINCVFEGRVILGNDVRIGANCVLANVEIGARTVVAPYSLLEDSAIGTDCRIGPYARIRPGAKLSSHVHIGNFVEIKNSVIGEHTNAAHLSYVGDAIVGAHVNVGAGVITCNYDGVNKHRTVVEDDVQIGSDVQLVAPVTVARGVTIGAGTTVWKNTPRGGLVINGKTQVHRPTWKRPAKQGG